MEALGVRKIRVKKLSRRMEEDQAKRDPKGKTKTKEERVVKRNHAKERKTVQKIVERRKIQGVEKRKMVSLYLKLYITSYGASI